MTERLTDRGCAAIIPPPKGNHLYFDNEVSGLALLVRAGGRKTFVFDWRERDTGKQRRLTLGRFPTWTVGKARLHAGKLRLKADTGDDSFRKPAHRRDHRRPYRRPGARSCESTRRPTHRPRL